MVTYTDPNGYLQDLPSVETEGHNQLVQRPGAASNSSLEAIRVYWMYLDAGNGEWLEYRQTMDGIWTVTAHANGCGCPRSVPDLLALFDRRKRDA